MSSGNFQLAKLPEGEYSRQALRRGLTMTVDELREKLDRLSRLGFHETRVVMAMPDGQGWNLSGEIKQGNPKGFPEFEVVALMVEEA